MLLALEVQVAHPSQEAHPLAVVVVGPFLVVQEALPSQGAHPLVAVVVGPFLVVQEAHQFPEGREAFPYQGGQVAVRVVEVAYRRSFHSTLSQYVAGIPPIVDRRITIANLWVDHSA